MSVKTYTVYDAELIEVNGNEEFVRGIESEANHTRVVLYTDYAALLERCEKMEKFDYKAAFEALLAWADSKQVSGTLKASVYHIEEDDFYAGPWFWRDKLHQALASKEKPSV